MYSRWKYIQTKKKEINWWIVKKAVSQSVGRPLLYMWCNTKSINFSNFSFLIYSFLIAVWCKAKYIYTKMMIVNIKEENYNTIVLFSFQPKNKFLKNYFRHIGTRCKIMKIIRFLSNNRSADATVLCSLYSNLIYRTTSSNKHIHFTYNPHDDPFSMRHT